MAMAVTWADSKAERHPEWVRLVRRLSVSLRLWARRRARRRFVRSVLAETAEPRMLADVGIRLVQPGHVERWAKAMVYHQH